MDRTKDNGEGWRQFLKKQLAGLDINWLDPTRKPIDIGKEDDASRRRRRKAKAAGDFLTVGKEMYHVRRVDLRMVDICDWMPINLNMDIHACGTYEELFLANRQKKPILVHCEQGKKEAPDWLYGVIPHQHIFGTWEELIAYVQHIAHDEVIDPVKRWYFFHPSVTGAKSEQKDGKKYQLGGFDTIAEVETVLRRLKLEAEPIPYTYEGKE